MKKIATGGRAIELPKAHQMLYGPDALWNLFHEVKVTRPGEGQAAVGTKAYDKSNKAK
jgi:hypothetical protein